MAQTESDWFVERFAGALARSGWPRMSARMFAHLMARPDGSSTAAGLASDLGVGASAISGGAKLLHRLGVIETHRRSDRQIVYEVRPDAWMQAVIGSDAELLGLERILTEGVAHATDDAARRLRETAEFFAFLRAELPALVERWRAER